MNKELNREVSFFGLPIFSKQSNVGYITRKYFGGILKTKKSNAYSKVYLFGVQIKNKYHLSKEISALKEEFHHLHSRQSKINQKLISTAFLHQKTFLPWKGAFRGKEIVLMGAGPSVNKFQPIKNAIYVGCNRAFRYDKVSFDFLFSIDKAGIENWYDEFFNYRKNDCIKFIGNQDLGINFQIPEDKIPLENVYRYNTNTNIEECGNFLLDISTSALYNGASVTIQALQWILYTQPKTIYLVGIDCTTSKNEYFISKEKEYNINSRGENPKELDEININSYKLLADFAKTYYPNTEIFSINPAGLKGIFKDIEY